MSVTLREGSKQKKISSEPWRVSCESRLSGTHRWWNWVMGLGQRRLSGALRHRRYRAQAQPGKHTQYTKCIIYFLKYIVTQVNQSHCYLQRMILLLKDKEALFRRWDEIYLLAFSSPSQKDLNLGGSGKSCLLVCNCPSPLTCPPQSITRDTWLVLPWSLEQRDP